MNTKRSLSILLILCMLLSSMQLTAFAKINNKAKSFDVPDVGLLLEAEDVTVRKGQGIIVERGGKSSGKYILSDKDWRNSDLANEEAAVEFFFVPKVEGTYNVWIRFAAEGDGADSIFLSANGSDFAQAPKTKSTGDSEIYAWAQIHTTPALKVDEKYNIGLLPREKGFRLDQIVVTNTSIVPTGLVTDLKNMKPDEELPAGTGLNEKAKVIDLADGGAIFEVEDVTVTESQGMNLTEEAGASGKKILIASQARGSNPPKISEQGAAEFFINPSEPGTYYIWLRYCALDDGTDSVFISANGGAYTQMNTPQTKETTEYAWIKVATTTPLKAGEKYNIRFMPREKNFRLDQILVTNVKRFIPRGEVSQLPDPNEYIIIPVDTAKYPAPTITPPSEHPRLMFRSSDIDRIKENMAKSESAYAVSEFNRLVSSDIGDGTLPESVNNKENYSEPILGGIEARAFDYAINGNEKAGREAVAAIKNYLKTIDFGDTVSILYRKQGYCVFIASEVYDWCYPLLTSQDKLEIVSMCQGMAEDMEIGWPPIKQGAVTGHGAESQLMRDILSLAIAAYDEYPDIYKMVAGRLLSEYIEPRDYFYESGTWHQGVSYDPYRVAAGMWMNYLFKVMCGYDVINADQSNMLDAQLYMRRSDGQLLREGDVMENANKGLYWTQSFAPFFMAANMFNNPYYKREVLRESPNYEFVANGAETISAANFLIINNADLQPRSIEELPKTKYFGSPKGMMIARTGWDDGYDSDDVLALMNIGEVYASNHDHLDSGNFQIYYKGILASESGCYSAYGSEYDYSFHKGTIAHNSLLIYDPNEKMTGSNIRNTGGQRGPSREFATFDEWQNGNFDTNFGKVIAHEYGPDMINPEYSYIKGDITNAYSDKVSEVLRSMLFVPTEDKAHPAIFLVMDKVTATNKDFDKYWIMHTQQEPEISGNTIVAKRDKEGYNGMLVNQTLYPKDVSISYVGGEGHENEFNQVTYPNQIRWGKTSCEESVTYRVDVRPSLKTETDYFLNAMYVGDADANLPLEQAELIETEQLLGAKLLNKVCIFTKDAQMLTNQSFTVNGSEDELAFVVTGLESGSYDISVNGSKLTSRIATAEGSAIYFNGPAGEYTIARTDANAVREPAEIVLPSYEIPVKIKVGTKFIYSDVNPVIVNDRTLLPMRALFENIGAEVTYDEKTSSATATDGETEVKITEDSSIAYVNGKEMTLDVPAMIIDDRFMVPVRFISESMGLTVLWAEHGQMVTITGVADNSALEAYGIPKKIAGVAEVTCLALQDGVAASEPLLAQNAVDLDPATLWAEEGDGRWLLVTLDKEYTIDAVAALFNNAASRTEKFSLEVSCDNQNWTKVLDHATTDGKTEDFQTFTFAPTNAKYVRYIGHGNSSSGWSALKEIVFVPAQ